jgi:RimJ/RimL family protein N-acetyltransferase
VTDTLAALPPLSTARLTLRRLEAADAAAVQAITDDPAITGAVHFLPTPFGLADAQALLRGADGIRDRVLGAWRRDDGALAGVLGAHLRDPDRIEIGYWFASAVHGRGYAREAAAALVAGLRGLLPHRTLVAECREANRPSWRLLEALGFVAAEEAGMRPGRRLLILHGDGAP